ncbi:MAG: hypothetical protein Q9M22_04010 [Mariprofundaceae bacterium]|nr:hypothetical protein [Mariprofundaceae bacterium]
MAARQIPSASAVVTIGAPCDPSHITHLFTGREQELKVKGELKITLGGRRFKIKQQFIKIKKHPAKGAFSCR